MINRKHPFTESFAGVLVLIIVLSALAYALFHAYGYISQMVDGYNDRVIDVKREGWKDDPRP